MTDNLPNLEAAVSDSWRETIVQKLADIEKEENIKILLAVESGSRAWGFHSPDSDYDVRFIYARSIEWHLSLEKKRDVVERPIDSELDLSGWELSKALTLALNSNAVIAEWLQSPIVYRQDTKFRSEVLEFCQHVLDRKSVTWHYLSLLKRQYDRSKDDQGNLKLKAYFYTIRPALALRWMRVNGASVPPMNMQGLMAGCSLPSGVESSLLELIEKKKVIKEKGALCFEHGQLDALIQYEVQFAERWLPDATALPSLSKHWAQASAINLKHSF